MIQLVVGIVENFKNLFKSSKVAEFKPVEKVDPAKMGFEFEHNELKRLMKRLKGFETVEFTDANGGRLTPEEVDKRFGPDGGIDCIIHIIAPTEQGAKNVATRIRNILIKGDF